MRFLISFFVIFTSLISSATLFAQYPEFNADSAYANNHHLAVNIGPRPMGSRGERASIQWAIDEFKRFGADTAYFMHMSRVGTTNTTTGNSVGIFAGQSDSIIVVGAHTDTDRSGNPGASDNASGTAIIVELARVWSKRPRPYTMVFSTFGAEERGLKGSKYFVDEFEDLDKVILMLNVDMAASEGWLIPFIDLPSHQTPRWLVEDSYAIARSLGNNDLDYPTHFFTINSALGGAGTDHMPFMEKEIPAIGFTAGINHDPIHTLQDRMEFVKKPMLERSGLLVDGLLEKYQKRGVPSVKTGNYMLWEAFGGRIYIPNWLIIIINIIAAAVGVLALLQSRRNDTPPDNAPRFNGLKMFMVLLVVVLFSQFGEMLLQLIKGVRYPWFAPYGSYMSYAGIWALAGIWVAFQIGKRWRFSERGHPYASTGLIVFLTMMAMFSGLSARMALYPALGTLMLGLAVLMPGRWLKVLAVFAGLPLFTLLFHEASPFLARSLTNAGFSMTSFAAGFMFTLMMTAIAWLWFAGAFFSVGYGLVASTPGKAFMDVFKSRWTGVGLLAVIIIYGAYLYGVPSFDAKWKPEVRIQADYDTGTGQSSMTVAGNEYLRDLTIRSNNLLRNIDDTILQDSLAIPFEARWMAVDGVQAVEKSQDDNHTVAANWQVSTTRPWYSLTVNVSSDPAGVEDVFTSLAYSSADNNLQLTWEAEPADIIEMEVRFAIPQDAKLIRTVTATYLELPVPVEAESGIAAITHRTTVTQTDTLVVR